MEIHLHPGSYSITKFFDVEVRCITGHQGDLSNLRSIQSSTISRSKKPEKRTCFEKQRTVKPQSPFSVRPASEFTVWKN
jgi:hypothetical protein